MRRSPTWIVREIEDRIILQLRKCSCIKELNKIHAHILVSFLSQSCFLSTQIINFCNAIGRIDYAHQVFNQVIHPNIFLYNAMIKAYTQNLRFIEAILLYKQILRRRSISGDRFTYPFLLKSCAGLLQHQLGKQIHLRTIISGLDSNPVVNNSLIEMYTKANDLTHAHKVFDEMPLKDPVTWNTLISSHARLGQMKKAMAIFNSMPNRTIVSWTAIISGYSRAGFYSEAVGIFRRMQIEGFAPDEVSIVSVLSACDLELGKWIQVYSEKHGFLNKTLVCNALIEMHSRGGSIEEALRLFEKTPQRDVFSWSTMVLGLAMNGRGEEAVKMFVEMEERSGVRPNGVTFLGLLTGCAHTGLVRQGLQYFSSMKHIYGIEPGVEHYGCIVDLLSRSGFISSAMEFIYNMPISPDAAIWGSLLSACRDCGNIEMAAMAMEELVRLEPDDLGNYVLLSNVYAGEKRWDDVGKMRTLMRNRRLKKEPGCSSIQVDDGVQHFMAGGDEGNLMRSAEMADMLQILAIMLAGKSGDFSSLNDEEEEDAASFFEAYLFL